MKETRRKILTVHAYQGAFTVDVTDAPDVIDVSPKFRLLVGVDKLYPTYIVGRVRERDEEGGPAGSIGDAVKVTTLDDRGRDYHGRNWTDPRWMKSWEKEKIKYLESQDAAVGLPPRRRRPRLADLEED